MQVQLQGELLSQVVLGQHRAGLVTVTAEPA